jgi:hypothetical protein
MFLKFNRIVFRKSYHPLITVIQTQLFICRKLMSSLRVMYSYYWHAPTGTSVPTAMSSGLYVRICEPDFSAVSGQKAARGFLKGAISGLRKMYYNGSSDHHNESH